MQNIRSRPLNIFLQIHELSAIWKDRVAKLITKNHASIEKRAIITSEDRVHFMRYLPIFICTIDDVAITFFLTTHFNIIPILSSMLNSSLPLIQPHLILFME
ncbi:hypothetical protein VPH35_111638 [Triticum aestivum]